MVDPDMRAIGGLALLRSVQSLVTAGTYDLLLGIPGRQEVLELVMRLGFRSIAKWQTFAQVMHSRTLMTDRYGLAGAILSPFLDSAASVNRRFSSFARRFPRNFAIAEIGYDELAAARIDRWPSQEDHILAELSSSAVQHRFLQHSATRYRLVGMFDEKHVLRGYAVLHWRPGSVVVCHCRTDIIATTELELILALCRSGTAYEGTVRVTTLPGSHLASSLRKVGFIQLPPRFGGYEYHFVGFWNSDHPLARRFADSSSWNLYPGFSDV
jgi:hypothetical protein